MSERGGTPRCEACGKGGRLVQFGDAGGYRYHCLTCWRSAAERVAVEYTVRVDGPVPGA
jgi:hypothetical protein